MLSSRSSWRSTGMASSVSLTTSWGKRRLGPAAPFTSPTWAKSFWRCSETSAPKKSCWRMQTIQSWRSTVKSSRSSVSSHVSVSFSDKDSAKDARGSSTPSYTMISYKQGCRRSLMKRCLNMIHSQVTRARPTRVRRSRYSHAATYTISDASKISIWTNSGRPQMGSKMWSRCSRWIRRGSDASPAISTT